MFDVESVGRAARSEFIRTLAEVLSKFDEFYNRNHDEYSPVKNAKCSTPGFDDVTSESDVSDPSLDPELLLSQFLNNNGNCVRLLCTKDVFNMLLRLYRKDELFDMGFKSIEVMCHNANSPTSTPTNSPHDVNATTRNVDIYLMRPTVIDSKLFKNQFGVKRFGMVAVVCLPIITDMYAETLQLLMGDGYFVHVAENGGNKYMQHNNVFVFGCEIHAVPIETNVLSMYMSNCYTDYYYSGDPTIPWFFAKAVEFLERRFLGGAIAQLNAVGALSKFVLQLLLQARREYTANFILDCMENVNVSNDTARTLNIELDNDCYNEPMSTDGGIMLGVSTEYDFGVVFDRRVDLITPMCSNFTYQGLLDSLFDLDENIIPVESSIIDGAQIRDRILPDLYSNFSKDHTNPIIKTINLDSNLYREIKWLNYNEVGPYLHSRAVGSKNQDMVGAITAATDLSAIDHMEDFVMKYESKQQEYMLLSQHVNLMSFISKRLSDDIHKVLRYFEDGILQGTIVNTLESKSLANITAKLLFKSDETPLEYMLDLIYWNMPVLEIYRLLILWSQTNNGIQMTDYIAIEKAIMIQYGFPELLTLERIVKCQLVCLCNNSDPNRWQKLCRRLNLLVDRDTSTSDYSGVFGGYAPLSLRLSQMLHVSQGQGETLNMEMGLLNCSLALLKQSDVTQGVRNDVMSNAGWLIGFIGGITLGEIAAVNLLRNKQPSRPLFLLTTDVVSASSMIKSISDINL